jgi:hypothetical protein
MQCSEMHVYIFVHLLGTAVAPHTLCAVSAAGWLFGKVSGRSLAVLASRLALCSGTGVQFGCV